jgi:hypothetical protein
MDGGGDCPVVRKRRGLEDCVVMRQGLCIDICLLLFVTE